MVDYTVEYEGQTANQNSDLVALSSSDLKAILPGENSNLADDTVLVPQGLWKSAGLNESSRLKAHGPLGEVELKTRQVRNQAEPADRQPCHRRQAAGRQEPAEGCQPCR